MKTKFLAIPVIAFLALSGCSSFGTLTAATVGTVSSVAPTAMNAAKKALTAAHLLHEAAADALTAAAQSNVCHAQCATTAKLYLDQSEAYLVAGDKLIALGDAPGIEAKISAATGLISQVQSLIGKAP